MNDPLLSLIKVAGITLLITVFWALTLGAAYWDMQRRKQAGQPVNTLSWMVLVALVPFLGFLIYFAARFLSRGSSPKGQAISQPGARRETRFKKPVAAIAPQPLAQPPPAPAASRGLPTIQVADFNKATVLGQQHSAQVKADQPGFIRGHFSVTRGPDQGKTFLVDQYPAQVGRDLESTIRLEQDAGVSRKHALVYQINGALRIRDLKSTHGTRVNGAPVTDQILNPGDRIEIGLTTLLYQEQGR